MWDATITFFIELLLFNSPSWYVLTVFAVGALALLTEKEHEFAVILLLFVYFIVTWMSSTDTKFLTFVASNKLRITLHALMYISIGVVYAVLRNIGRGRHIQAKVKEARDCFVVHDPSDTSPKDTKHRWHVHIGRFVNRSEYKFMQEGPSVKTIRAWIFLWPFSLIFVIIGDGLMRALNSIARVYKIMTGKIHKMSVGDGVQLYEGDDLLK